MSGQIVDATLVAAPRQRNTDAEKAAIRAGKTADEICPDKPARARQKDVEARWTVKVSKAKPATDGTPQTDLAIPVFGYKSHISIDRRHGIIRRQTVTDAAAHDGARLREGLIDPNNTASDVWADSAYRSAENERYLARIGKTSRIHRRKPRGKPMPKRTAKANAAKSAVRARVEHPFAHQKGPMGLFIRTIGLARAKATVMLANIAYNMKRWCWLDRRNLPA
jgi:transposase, IS5 family